ncbi:ABC transporter substrate-binding protein [Alteribacillus iranensis]|uniref:Iron complex transport system substrate-binding protein n=1 Tax=Alteribacillus iranensis TaxID=930128 RepID=A0A1I1ZMC5_9BACI|nr:ABC transporter substrate-binding protein [Alteribacillus iranensis]SFE32974.1 iron complex transport system substrate-binding protein [Alteribacillus iranensis]
MKKMTSIVAGVSLFIISACGGVEEEPSSEEQANQTEQQQEEGQQEENAFPLEVTDAAGNEITIEEKPDRIVSVVPSNTEIAFALGLEEEIVGVTDFDNYPEEAAEKTSVGGLDFDMETVLSLQPDLVLARESSSPGGSNEAFSQLEDAGIDVFIVNSAESFEETYDSIELIGEAVGEEDAATQLVNDMEAGVAEIKDTAENIPEEVRKKVWVEIQPAPDLYTTGKGTFMHEMLEIIHAENVAETEEGWVPFSEEEVVSLQPEIIITTYGESVDGAGEMIAERSGWESIPAVKNNNVYDINNDIVSRPGPRLVDGLEELAASVYPDVFEEE